MKRGARRGIIRRDWDDHQNLSGTQDETILCAFFKAEKNPSRLCLLRLRD